MEIAEFKKDLQKKIKDLSTSIQYDLNEDIPKQTIINMHLVYIEHLLNQGYTLPLLLKKLEIDVKDEHFRTLVRIARKKAKSKAIEPATV